MNICRTITRIAICTSGSCMGMDASAASSLIAKSGVRSASLEQLTILFEAIELAAQIILSGIVGPAYCSEIGLALACDIRLDVATAIRPLSDARLPLDLTTICPCAVRELGTAFAREAMLSVRPIKVIKLPGIGAVARLVVHSEEELSDCSDQYSTKLRTCVPRASILCDKLVRSVWRDAGAGEFVRITLQVFDEMMQPGRESECGLKEFQAGRKRVGWDERVRIISISKL